MEPGTSSGPGAPLDDDWLFTDPMAIDWAGGRDGEPMHAGPSAVCSRPARRRLWLLAAALIFAAGAVVGAMVSGGWHARLSFSAVPCPPAHASRAGVAPPAPDRES